ncbi:MAG: hypothetical protein HQL75_11900 [Magnetococcales bacterium]|nr:hypothetical protein [Magnetococcales bacterium]
MSHPDYSANDHRDASDGGVCSGGLKRCFSEFSSDPCDYERLRDLECLKHRVIQFFSVDIVDSTAMKQAGQDTGDWMNPVVNFFGQITHSFDRAWDCAKKNLEWIKKFDKNLTTGPAPEFFKGNGDEAIFQKELKHPAEALYLLYALRDEISRLDIKGPLSSDGSSRSLQYKVSSWVASFPVPNRRIVLRQKWGKEIFVGTALFGDYILRNFDLIERYYEDRSKALAQGGGVHYGQDFGLVIDYVGPSLDTGFRVSSLANSRRLTFSLELAQIMAAVHSHITKCQQQGVAKEYKDYTRSKRSGHSPEPIPALDLLVDCEIFLLGFHSLKGVLKGAPFPVFWIPASPKSDALLKDEVLSKLDWYTLFDSLSEFIEQHKGDLFPVYMPEDSWNLFNVLDKDRQKKHFMLMDSILEPIKKRKIETELSSGNVDAADDNASGTDDQIVEDFLLGMPQR